MTVELLTNCAVVPKTIPVHICSLIAMITYSLISSMLFILVRVPVDLVPMPGALGETLVYHGGHLQTFAHLFTPTVQAIPLWKEETHVGTWTRC